MSRWRAKPCYFLLTQDTLALLGDPGKEVAWNSNDETSLNRALSQLLATTRAQSAVVLLSGSLTNYVVLPGMNYWLGNDDLSALASSRLASFYGGKPSDLAIALNREGYDQPSLAASAAQSLIGALQRSFGAQGVKLLSIKPLVSHLLTLIERELVASPSASVWIEEPGALWIGLRNRGAWLSARSLPAYALTGTSHHDLLQRESLAAGLPEAGKLYCISLNGQIAANWEVPTIDLSARWQTAKVQTQQGIEFIAQSGNRLGIALLIASLIAMAATLFTLDTLEQRDTARIQQQELLQAGKHQLEAETRVKHQATETEYAKAVLSYRAQTVPWGNLLLTLNECGGDALGLVVFRANATDGSIGIDGEAKQFDDIQAFMDRLAAKPILQDIKLATATLARDAYTGNIRFALTARWINGSPVKASINP